jgi:hypothetical protein
MGKSWVNRTVAIDREERSGGSGVETLFHKSKVRGRTLQLLAETTQVNRLRSMPRLPSADADGGNSNSIGQFLLAQQVSPPAAS